MCAEILPPYQDGTILLFPSEMSHRVDMNETNEDRLSISFILFSSESTVDNTAIIVKIPIVTPNNESIVLTGFAIMALNENIKLSLRSLKNNFIN